MEKRLREEHLVEQARFQLTIAAHLTEKYNDRLRNYLSASNTLEGMIVSAVWMDASAQCIAELRNLLMASTHQALRKDY